MNFGKDDLRAIKQSEREELFQLAQAAEDRALEAEGRGVRLELTVPENATLFRRGQSAFRKLAVRLLEIGEQYPLNPTDYQFSEGKQLVERAVWLCGHAKSGTTLLRNLLDGHPQILLIPVDGAVGFRKARYLRDITGMVWSQDFQVNLVERLLNPMGLTPPRWPLGSPPELEVYLNFCRYLKAWRAKFPETAKGDVQTSVCAFHSAKLADAECSAWSCWAEKTARTFEDAAELSSFFPESKFVQIIRHPCAVYKSFRDKMTRKGKHVHLIPLMRRLRTAMGKCRENQALFPQRYHLVYFERLLESPDEESRLLAEFLAVDFDSLLTKPTVGGTAATPNTAFAAAKSPSGVLLPDRVDLWREKLSHAELDVLEYFLRDEMLSHGYQPASRLQSWQLPGRLLQVWQDYRDSPYLHLWASPSFSAHLRRGGRKIAALKRR